MNYHTHGDGTLAKRYSRANDGSLVYRCPVCDNFRPAFAILKVQAAPITSENWACDGCWGTWKREMVAIGPKNAHFTAAEWQADFFEVLGSQDVESLRATARRSLERLADKLTNDRARMNPSDQVLADVKLAEIARRLK